MKKSILVFFILLFVGASLLFAGNGDDSSLLNSPESSVRVFLETEQGFLSVLFHTLQFGEDGTNFDYRTMGGQEILYPFERYLAGVEIRDKHRISFLYQPLTLTTFVRFKEQVVIDDVTFPQGTPMELTYGFPFYRVTYGFDFLKDKDIDLGVGGALQLRNASIRFRDLSGDNLTVNQNLGPVPAL